jgi:hypothetical protein
VDERLTPGITRSQGLGRGGGLRLRPSDRVPQANIQLGSPRERRSTPSPPRAALPLSFLRERPRDVRRRRRR